MPDTNFDSLRLTSGYLQSAAVTERMGLGTIPTTVGVESTFIAKFAGTLTLVQFVPGASLATSDTNFLILGINNRGSGAANVAMLAPGAVNGTQVTGGTALTAYTKRTLTLNATPANLVIAAGDTISVVATVTGTLAGTVPAASLLLTFAPS